MEQVAVYIGGMFGAAWVGLVLFVAGKCFFISAEQIREDILGGGD